MIKKVWWAMHYDDLKWKEQDFHFNQYLFYFQDYFPVPRYIIFGINLNGKGFGPFKTYDEANKTCKRFNVTRKEAHALADILNQLCNKEIE